MSSPVKLAIVAWCALAAGCVRVRPYQRELLAAPAMQAPVWSTVTAADEHMFLVREGTGGAVTSGGGGCGCN